MLKKLIAVAAVALAIATAAQSAIFHRGGAVQLSTAATPEVRCAIIFVGGPAFMSQIRLNNHQIVDGDVVGSVQVISSNLPAFWTSFEASASFSTVVEGGVIVQHSGLDLTSTVFLATILKGS